MVQLTRLTDDIVKDLASSTRTIMLDAVKIHVLQEALSKIAELSTGWKHGSEGVHLLRINDIVMSVLTPNDRAISD